MNHECETCKHTELNGYDYPCHCCSVVYPNTGFSDMWEQAGCEFCRGEKDIKKGYIEISAFEIRGKKHLTVDISDGDCCGDEAIDEESFEINYCPMCGTRIKEKINETD